MYAIRSYYAGLDLIDRCPALYKRRYIDGIIDGSTKAIVDGFEKVSAGIMTTATPTGVITSYSIHYTKLYDSILLTQ